MLVQNDFWYILSTQHMLVIIVIIITTERLCTRPGLGRGDPAETGKSPCSCGAFILAGKINNKQVSQNNESEFQRVIATKVRNKIGRSRNKIS